MKKKLIELRKLVEAEYGECKFYFTPQADVIKYIDSKCTSAELREAMVMKRLKTKEFEFLRWAFLSLLILDYDK